MKTEYVNSIRKAYPELNIFSAELNHQGQNSDVLIVNGEWVFRFPKYDHVLEIFRTEAVILSAIQGYLPLSIPSPSLLQLDGLPLGQAFMGYRLIPGEPLWRDTFNGIADRIVRDRFAEQLSVFLRVLHSFPARERIPTPIPCYDTRAEWLDIYERIQQKLFEYMRPEARVSVKNHFESYLDNLANFDYQPVLKHSDFGTSNILFDPNKSRITGIIDFSNAGMGDPAYDFAGLLSSYGEPFIERCAGYYPGLVSILPRVHFYRGTFALYEALFGIENGDSDALQAGLSTYI